MLSSINLDKKHTMKIGNHNLTGIILFISLLISSCGSDEPKSILTIDEVIPLDVGNNSDGSDIYVRTVMSEQVGSTFKYFVTKASSNSAIDLGFLKGLSSDKYTTTEGSSIRVNVRLQASQLDTDGDAIQQSVAYQIVVLNEEENVMSNISRTLTLKETGVLNGKYRGTWNDNIYSNFGITAVISSSSDFFSGPFYYSNGLPDFSPCCGGSDDGSISFTLEDQKVSNFIYNQDLLTYMGGCPGTYEGTGTLRDIVTLSINFTGNDCDGTHTGGKIELARIE